MEHLQEVVNIVERKNVFPLQLGAVPLRRQVVVIDSGDDPVKLNDHGVDLSYYQNQQECENVLTELLELLDKNLGAKYSRVNRQLYHNNRQWRDNKWEEMLSLGLVYVVYRGARDKAVLFLSFMLTEEEGVLEATSPSLCSVLYLYEIQIHATMQSKRLGSKLICECLAECCRMIRDTVMGLQYPFYGIELTVFSDNLKAINFYQKIGMKLAADSPIDKITYLQPRRTRQNKDSTARKLVEKPLYYLYVLSL